MIEQVRLNRWYPIVRYPTELAAECVATGAFDEQNHVVTWAPAQYGGKCYLAFWMAPYAAIQAETDFMAQSAFKRFRITKFLPNIIIDPKTPLLEPTMYLVAAEVEAQREGYSGYYRTMH